MMEHAIEMGPNRGYIYPYPYCLIFHLIFLVISPYYCFYPTLLEEEEEKIYQSA